MRCVLIISYYCGLAVGVLGRKCDDDVDRRYKTSPRIGMYRFPSSLLLLTVPPKPHNKSNNQNTSNLNRPAKTLA